ncbi:MAG: multidrug efflux SMR transporter [Isosphaeraceae bacterium]|nr:multidrug efflux SMR transporter [Isosphaeraceae bacterium]
MYYLYLSIAILSEVIATTALKASDGCTKFAPSMLVFTGYGVAFYFLSLCLKKIHMGAAYAIWSGVGIVLITAVGAVVYKQAVDLAAVVGMALIVAGVLVLNLFSKSVAH